MSPFQLLFNFDIKILNFGGIIKQITNFIFHHKMYTIIKRNRILERNENKKENLYICALGPSLKEVDLYKIKGHTMVVNRFFKIGEKFPDFIPTYYVIIDSLFASKGLSPELKCALDLYIPKGTIFLLNSQLADSEVLDGYNKDQIFFLSSFSGELSPNKDYRLSKVLPIFENVAGAAIIAGVCMNYKNIKLLGCDFNSFASTVRNHCYKDEKSERWYRMSRELFAYAFAANMHDNINTYAERKGARIFNSTKGSLIDAYPMEIDNSLYFNSI